MNVTVGLIRESEQEEKEHSYSFELDPIASSASKIRVRWDIIHAMGHRWVDCTQTNAKLHIPTKFFIQQESGEGVPSRRVFCYCGKEGTITKMYATWIVTEQIEKMVGALYWKFSKCIGHS